MCVARKNLIYKNESDAWDNVQENRNCCGVYGYSDWYECDECVALNSFPNSCCIKPEEINCGELQKQNSESIASSFHFDGCFSKLFKLIDKHFLYCVLWFSLFIALQVMVIIISCLYIVQLNKNKNFVQIFYDTDCRLK